MLKAPPWQGIKVVLPSLYEDHVESQHHTRAQHACRKDRYVDLWDANIVGSDISQAQAEAAHAARDGKTRDR